MSRRAPNPAAERAAQNQATIKNLLKLECNKTCADCKRNKHPRWASWNLGIFICIRCSGIHRGMGTHISRVKSVDLDAWTDEQLQSVLNWGNARANKYWEHKLAAGHAPSESKIENFIRTKYELKRWVMDGPKPDPSTLDVEGDDDVPLSLVKEKQTIERKESIRKASLGQSQAPRNIPAPQGDLIGGDDIPRASTAGPPPSKVPPKAEPVPPKATSTKDSLLGLDFLGESSAPPRPASTTGVSSGGQSRPDLKQSILSLYASAPKPQPQHQRQQSGSFGGIPSPTLPQQQQQQQQGFGGGFNDAFGSLSIGGGAAPPKPAPADPFASLGGGSSMSRPAAQTSNSNAFGGLGGGSFFNQKPAQPAQQQMPSSSSQDLFGSFASPAPAAAPVTTQPKPAQSSSSAMGDLFDLSGPSFSSTTSPPPAAAMSPPASSSVFNLSAPQSKPAAPAPQPVASPTPPAFNAAALAGADVWGGSAWGSTDTKPKSPEVSKSTTNDFGWGSAGGFSNTPIVPSAGGGFNPAPKVSADEEFGGWASSTGPTTSTAGGSGAGKPAGGDDDLFSNVWQ